MLRQTLSFPAAGIPLASAYWLGKFVMSKSAGLTLAGLAAGVPKKPRRFVADAVSTPFLLVSTSLNGRAVKVCGLACRWHAYAHAQRAAQSVVGTLVHFSAAVATGAAGCIGGDWPAKPAGDAERQGDARPQPAGRGDVRGAARLTCTRLPRSELAPTSA